MEQNPTQVLIIIYTENPTKILITFHKNNQYSISKITPKIKKTPSPTAGHDHVLEHITQRSSNFDYWIAGTANKIDPFKHNRKCYCNVEYFWGNPISLGAFMTFTIDEVDGATMKFIEAASDEVLYSSPIAARK